MAEFIITARIAAPDDLIGQSRLVTKVAGALDAFREALAAAIERPVTVELTRARKRKGAAAPTQRRPRKPKAPNGEAAQPELPA